MFVEKWMTANPLTVPPQMSISAAALQMAQHKFRHLLVAESKLGAKKLLGLLSKYDIARAFPGHFNPFSLEVTEDTVAQPISTIMNRSVVTVTPESALEEAARILRTRRINALPVVRGPVLVGIITESDIFDALLDFTGANGAGTKFTLESHDVHQALTMIAQIADQHHLEIVNAVSFRDRKSSNKVISQFRFASRPNQEFVQALAKHGFRLVKFG